MIRVYVAGAYSAPNILQVLENMRKGMKACTELFLTKKYAVFCPWIDYHFSLMKPDDTEITIEHYYNYSTAWLEVSDAVLVLPGYENSKGTLAEIKRANELFIPVFYSRQELDDWFDGQQYIDFQTQVKNLEP